MQMFFNSLSGAADNDGPTIGNQIIFNTEFNNSNNFFLEDNTVYNISNGHLNAINSVDYEHRAYSTVLSSQSKMTIDFDFNFETIGSFCFGKYGYLFQGSINVDPINDRIQLGTTSTSGFVAAHTEPIPTGFFNTLNVFNIKMVMDFNNYTIILTNKDIASSVTLMASNDDKTGNVIEPNMYGGVGFYMGNSSIRISKLSLYVNRLNPKVIAFGDSLVSETSIMGDTSEPRGIALTKRWPVLFNSDQSSFLCSGWGGNKTSDLLNRIDYDVIQHLPKYCIIQIGSNETDYNTWSTNINLIITKLKNIGCTPVICTIPPRNDVDRSGIFALMNDDILNNLNESHIDIAAMATVNNDRVTQDLDKYVPDGVHFNIEGNMDYYNQIITDAPFLL